MKQYIDKAALVTEIERKIEAHKETLKNCDSSISEMVLKSSMSAYQNLLHFLDTIEVKEVDIEKEWEEYFKDRGDVATVNIKHLAKYFFELGIRASNPIHKNLD
jgi:hypothetical protein